MVGSEQFFCLQLSSQRRHHSIHFFLEAVEKDCPQAQAEDSRGGGGVPEPSACVDTTLINFANNAWPGESRGNGPRVVRDDTRVQALALRCSPSPAGERGVLISGNAEQKQIEEVKES